MRPVDPQSGGGGGGSGGHKGGGMDEFDFGGKHQGLFLNKVLFNKLN